MNDDTYTPCTKCGRPMKYCKGQCCGKPRGCECKEYGPAVCGVIRQRQPECPYTAVIPSMVVEHADNLKDLCDTFVHVSDLNTTFYIDDKHRTIITWAGPVEYDNYDLVANSLGLRSQFLIDFANERGAYYDKTGNYQVFNFGDSAIQNKVLHVYVPSETSGGDPITADHTTAGLILLPLGSFFETPSVTVTDDDGNAIEPAQFMDMRDVLGDYTLAIHIPEMRVWLPGDTYTLLSAETIYYHVSAVSEQIPAIASHLPSYRDPFNDCFAAIAGTDVLGAYLGYDDYIEDDYTAQIILPAY